MTSNGTMPNSSKKRKASELDSDFDGKPPKTKTQRRPKGHKSDSKVVEDIPFRPECPYKPSTKAHDDVYIGKDEIAPGFEFEFAVRPGKEWKEMRSYRNVKLQDHTFSVGTVIYINKQFPPPKSPDADASDAEILRYDRSNFWVGRIADTRAVSDKAVYLRVYWLYWPEELPMGRQPYHGDRELILSNAMDIVDAQTISWVADLTFWDERDSNHQYRDRFWRQTLDISKLGKDQKGGLSELRRHCKCRQPHNPDRTMFECKRTSCKTWNHEECLVDDALQRAWSVYEKEHTLESIQCNPSTLRIEEGESTSEQSSLQQRLLTPVRQLGKIMQNKMTPSVNTVIEQAMVHSVEGVSNGVAGSLKKGKTSKKTAKSNRNPAPTPWEGKLTARIINTNDKDEDSPILAKVDEVAGSRSNSEAKSWYIRVNCLVCGQTM